MRKEFLKTAKILNKAEQKKIFGGFSDEIRMGTCIVDGVPITVRCDITCPNGSMPFCFKWDDEVPV